MHAISKRPALAVLAATAADSACASELAQRLALPLLSAGLDPEHCDAAATVLLVSARCRRLQRTGRGAPGPVAVDFTGAHMRRRRASGAPELLGRAVGHGKKSGLRVLDATAGLGRDAFVLASLGCEVLMCEREPVVAELLRSGLELALEGADPRVAEAVRHMRLHPVDARQMGALHLDGVDVIYLDPMFPPRSKSAAVKKEMTLFQDLLHRAGESGDAEDLLEWALGQDVARVVVKRPARASSLAGQQTSHSIHGKAVRYDVYVHRRIE